jgi:hypothetical protein
MTGTMPSVMEGFNSMILAIYVASNAMSFLLGIWVATFYFLNRDLNKVLMETTKPKDDANE